MLEFRSVEQFAFFVKIGKNHRVCFLNKYASVWCLSCQVTFSIYKLYEWKVILTAHTAIVFTECRSNMNDTGTIAHGNVVIAYNVVCFFALGCYIVACAFEKRLVLFVFQILTFVSLKNFVCRLLILRKLAKYFVKKGFCHIIGVSVCSFYLAVGLIRIYTKCNVGWQCPRRGGPCQEICILANNLETCDCRAFFY